MRKIPIEYEDPIDNILTTISEKVSPTFHNYGFTPNMVTTLSNISAIIVILLLLQAKYIWAALFFILAYFFDCLDGHLARKYKQFSKFGDYYDHISDFCKTMSILFTMYWINSDKFYQVIPVIIIAGILQYFYLGCQEKYIDLIKNSTLTSDTLQYSKKLCPAKSNTKESIENAMKYTKYVGPGIFSLVFALSILYYDF